MDFRHRKMNPCGTLSVIEVMDGEMESDLLTTEFDRQKYIMAARLEEQLAIWVQEENSTGYGASLFHCGKGCNGPWTIGIYLPDPALEALDCPQTTPNYPLDNLAFQYPVCPVLVT